MDGRRALIRGIELTILVLVLLLLVGQVIGQPVLLSFVETGSMAPTLQPGDGFIAIPTAVAGPIEEGDVVVFDAEELHGGGLVTHRVVGTTPDGQFITKGDANPFTDQDGPEPPVQRAQIVAKALQVGGNVVVIPGLGVAVLAASSAVQSLQEIIATTFRTRAVLGTQGLAYLLFGVGILAYLVSLFAESGGSTRRNRQAKRDSQVVSGRTVILALTLLLVVVVTASMMLSGGTHSFKVVSSSSDAPGPRVIKAGTSETLAFTIPSNGIIPVVVFLETSGGGISVEPSDVYVPGGKEAEVNVTLTASEQTGPSTKFMTEHRYFAVLPRGTISTLYHIHPWLPIVVIDLLIGGGFATLGIALLGTGRIRMRPSRSLSLSDRIRRLFR